MNTFGFIMSIAFIMIVGIAVVMFAMLLWFAGIAIMEIPIEIRKLREVIEERHEVKGDDDE